MYRSKKFARVLFSLVSLVVANSVLGLAIMPPTISFFTDGRPPVSYGKLNVANTVYVNMTDSLNQRVAIYGLYIKGDSLIINTMPVLHDPQVNNTRSSDVVSPPYPNTVVFNKAGFYKAYAFSFGGIVPLDTVQAQESIAEEIEYNPLGKFRIFPIISTSPGVPVAGKPVILKLTVGRTYSSCVPAFIESHTLQKNKILLDYTEIMLAGCVGPKYVNPPIKYGPVFELGKLSVGTYQVYIEDTVNAGSISVADTAVVKGAAHVMQHPLVNMMPRPVSGVQIEAVRAPHCEYWLPGGGAIADTFKTMTGTNGRFFLELPQTGNDYEITATKDGFHVQALFVKPDSLKGLISFELIDRREKAIAELEVVVTNKGTPVESVHVSIYGGREPLICPTVAGLAKTAYEHINYSGYTGSDGKLFFNHVSLSPYIHYGYHVYKSGRSKKYIRNGTIRLNKYWKNTLEIDFGTTDFIEEPLVHQIGNLLSVSPNPFYAATIITFPNQKKPASLAIYDLAGRLVENFKDVKTNSIVWNAKNLSSGLYMLNVRVGEKQYIKNLMLMR